MSCKHTIISMITTQHYRCRGCGITQGPSGSFAETYANEKRVPPMPDGEGVPTSRTIGIHGYGDEACNTVEVHDLKKLCYQASLDNGWWNTSFARGEELSKKEIELDEMMSSNPASKAHDEKCAYLDARIDELKDVLALEKGAKYALMHSELSEGLEGVRKPGPSDKIPEFTIEEEELADTIIRIMDYAGRFGLRIASAIVAKIEFNKSRGYKHGGKKI